MPEEAIRFGVTNEHAQRSSTWKLWSRVGGGKSDVYLTCRALRGAAKASLHESGNWHVAFAKEYLDLPPRVVPQVKLVWPQPSGPDPAPAARAV